MTRRVTGHQFYSIDGVAESPNLWQYDRFGPDEMAMMGSTLGGVTDVVIGRVLWEEWREYWQAPEAAGDGFGQFINPVRKHVVTTTLRGDLGWNSAAIESDSVDYVRRLAADEAGEMSGGTGDIAVVGGMRTIESLFLAGVIDALTLAVHPVVAGTGRRLFEGVADPTRLELVDSTITSVGNAMLTYALRPSGD